MTDITVKVMIFLMSLFALVWRLSDLVDEVSQGVVKMSVGVYQIRGNDALLAQVLIIGLLVLLLFVTRKNILLVFPHRSKNS
ncbi:MAG: hypothetical protein V7459_15920 [Oceanicoccus sp.]